MGKNWIKKNNLRIRERKYKWRNICYIKRRKILIIRETRLNLTRKWASKTKRTVKLKRRRKRLIRWETRLNLSKNWASKERTLKLRRNK